MTLEICPSCNAQDSIFLALRPAATLDGKLLGGRIEAFCNNTQCDQRYWFFAKTGRVTRRNVGPAYTEWRRHLDDLMPSLIALRRRPYAWPRPDSEADPSCEIRVDTLLSKSRASLV